jgi:hypothetical protein
MRATALFISLLALISLSYGQDTIGLATCPTTVTAQNSACLSRSFGYVDTFDLSDSTFCADGFILTQCIDGSCINSDTSDALRLVVPQLFRPNVCPLCSSIPFILESSRAVCTMFGLNHLVPFNRSPNLCTPITGNGTVLLMTNFITLTALTSPTENYTAITGVRFDYHGCVVFSQTWNGRDAWSSDRVPTAGWFPHTIRIVQNATSVSISLAALNTDIIINKVGRFLAVSIGYGVRNSLTDSGACVSPTLASCTSEDLLLLPSPTTPPCTTVPAAFGRGKQKTMHIHHCTRTHGVNSVGCYYDLLVTNSSEFGQNAVGAATIDANLRALVGNGTILQDLNCK